MAHHRSLFGEVASVDTYSLQSLGRGRECTFSSGVLTFSIVLPAALSKDPPDVVEGNSESWSRPIIAVFKKLNDIHLQCVN